MKKRNILVKIGIGVIALGIALMCYPIVTRYEYARQQRKLWVSYQEQSNAEVIIEEALVSYLEIPKIDEKLPIYDSTEEENLRRGVGILEGTDALGGKEGTHAVICGHAGFAKATLFSNLKELELGDEFYIYLGKDKLVYEIDQILVVRPEEQEALLPVEGKAYVTLLTCTPPGQNSHRLLVRGVRKE